MAKSNPGKTSSKALWFAPIIIVPVAFVASIPWLKQQSDAFVLGVAAATSIFVMSYAIFLTARVTRHLDEVEIAGQRFAQANGWTIGMFAAGLVIVFPPAINALVDLANTIGAGSPDKAVRIAIVIGFMMVIILQTLGTLAAAFWWGRRTFGPRS